MTGATKQAISEEDIRPQRFNEAKAATVRDDLQYLLDRQDRFVSVNCPACGAAGAPSFQKKGMQYDECPECRTAFVNPRPAADLLHEFYGQSKVYEFWNKYIFPASEDARRKSIFAPRVRRLIEICRSRGAPMDSLLEVGAGFGTFCEEAQGSGAFGQVTGIELTPHLAETCRRRGLTVHETPVEKADLPPESFDVIASFETIEHIFDPRGFIEGCARLLKPGGVLVLSCPNFHGFDIMALGTDSNSIDHEHLNYFNPRSFRRLLESCGFDVLSVETPGELDADIVRNKILQGAVDLKGAPFLRHLLLDRWEDAGQSFQKFLRDNALSSHMWASAVKPRSSAA